MSKAFARESDEADTDDVASARPPLSVGVKNYITREGADRLRQRLVDLLEERRVLAAKTGEEKANAVAALKRVESEIRKVHSILDSAIVAERPADEQKVALGAWVQVRDKNGEEETYQIVGVEEADPAQSRISSASPLARVLLSKRPGEKVRFQSPAGPHELMIINVRY